MPKPLLFKRYLICPGFVTSRFDGDKHYISAKQLMCLYNVYPEECVIADDDAG